MWTSLIHLNMHTAAVQGEIYGIYSYEILIKKVLVLF